MSPRRQRRGRQRPRAKQPKGASRVGERFEAVVGPVAHGGHCVVRLDAAGARVVFVRHAIPGERVVLEITEGTDGDRFWRGDAVEVLEPSPDRVTPPCPYAGPGLCGGCDFQHVALPAQRALKTAVVREQLSRLAGLTWDGEVEAVPGDEDGLHWRTRQRYVALRRRPGDAQAPLPRAGAGRRLPARGADALGHTGHRVETVVPEHLRGRRRGLLAGAPRRARVLVDTVLGMLAPQPGE